MKKKTKKRKEMFYLMTHSTHFIYEYIVKDNSDSERGNPLTLLAITFKGFVISTLPQTG